MDVLTLLKFWQTTTIAPSDPPATGYFNPPLDDDDSFFDLVFTSSGDHSRSSFGFSSPDKRRILPLDSPNTKMPHSPLRLLNLGFPKHQKSKLQSQTCSHEFEEEEEATISVLLKRDNSLRNKLRSEKLLEHDYVTNASSKRFSNDVINKYLNRMKSSYVNVKKRSVEKSRLSDSSMTPSSSPLSSLFSPRKDEKKSGGRTVFKDVRKHLGKSRSSSSIVQSPARKSDDSVLEQQDGIQRAILHCKRSYSSSSQDCMLSRSGSAPLRVSIEEEKRSSI